ncbi:unnamed protein product [Durusdinium trenchii]|uniref:SbsA Ig-like domain-containing protein n=1 Tax=Durusdinium trenchii TaxID=1381693 RepID=A0ABP0QDF4_9DINO
MVAAFSAGSSVQDFAVSMVSRAMSTAGKVEAGATTATMEMVTTAAMSPMDIMAMATKVATKVATTVTTRVATTVTTRGGYHGGYQDGYQGGYQDGYQEDDGHRYDETMGDAKTIGPKEEGAEPRQGVPPQAGPVEALEEPVPAAGEDLPPPEEEAPEEVAPVETNEVEQQTEAPDEQTEAPDELSGPPLMLVNSEGQNLLAKEKTRQLINKVNLLSKSLQAVCEAKRDEEDLPPMEEEMREICRVREGDEFDDHFGYGAPPGEVDYYGEHGDHGWGHDQWGHDQWGHDQWGHGEYGGHGPTAPGASRSDRERSVRQRALVHSHGRLALPSHGGGLSSSGDAEPTEKTPRVSLSRRSSVPSSAEGGGAEVLVVVPRWKSKVVWKSKDTGDAERIDFSTTLVNRVSSDEEVVQGTISLNGTITPESVSKLNWAAQNALVQACGHGSKVIANAVLQLSWVTRRGVDIKFFVLPRLGGGGDCARTLVEGSAGAFEPPFQVSGALRKPIFRNMMQNELELLGFGALMSDMYLRLWRITCDVQPVWRNGNSLTEQNPVTICGTYASGWEVYFEPSITEPATAVGVSLGYSAGNTGSVAQQFSDKCMVANSPCFCSSMSSCGWRRKEDGVGMHCKTLDSSDTATPVTCDACAQQPGCPPSCSSASYPCHCASIEATCRWDVTTGVCLEGPAPNGEDVPCSSCSLQDRCQALRPRALEFRPNSIFALTREGPKSLIEVDFNVALALPAVAARAAARFLCGTDGFDPLANSLQLLEYVVPPEALLVEGRTLKLASGTVQVVEPTRCTLILSGGVVSSRDDGLPSQPVEFGEYYFNMKDSVPPQVAAFWPANGAGSVPTVTQWITISFSERIRATESFEALLTRTDVMGEPADPPVAVSLHSVHQRTMTLAIQGLLGPGRFYQLTISDKSIIDYGSLAFEGITAGAYKFKTEGTYEEVQVIEAPAESLPGAAIAGIVGGAVVLLLTALFLCYRGYIAASEKDDLVHVIEQDDNNKKKNKKEKSNEPPAIFGSDASGRRRQGAGG